MRYIQTVLQKATSQLRTWGNYARAVAWSCKGANIGKRVAIGGNSRIEYPWRVSLGERALLEHAVWIKLVASTASVSIGNRTYVGTGTQMDVMDSLTIGDHTLIAPGCFITDHNHGLESSMRIDEQRCSSKPVTIGSDVWLGAKVIVLPGVTIGDGAVVAAASVVRDNVLPGTIVAGVPARYVGLRR